METNKHSVKDLSVEEVSAELGMHPETIRRLLTAGAMPGYKAGRHWRITRMALDGWKKSGGVRRPGRPTKDAVEKEAAA